MATEDFRGKETSPCDVIRIDARGDIFGQIQIHGMYMTKNKP